MMNLRKGKARTRANTQLKRRHERAGVAAAKARRRKAPGGPRLRKARRMRGHKGLAAAVLALALVAGCGMAATAMARAAGAAAARGDGDTLEARAFSVAEKLSAEVDTTGAVHGADVDWWTALLARFASAQLADTGKRVRTKATFVDAAKYSDGQGVDELMADPKAAADVFLTQLEWKSAVYEFGDADFYAAKLDAVHETKMAGAARGWAFARDTYDGQAVDGVVYDAASGIAYIPKAAVDGYTPADETHEQGCAMQAQLLFTADADAAATTVSGTARVVDSATGEAFTAATAGSFFGNETYVQLACAEEASLIEAQSISVRVNDGAAAVAGSASGAAGAGDAGAVQADATVAGYDASTGVLGISVPAAAAGSIEVCYEAHGADVPALSSGRALLGAAVSEMECVPGVEFSGLDLDKIGEGWTFGSTVYVDSSGSNTFPGRDVDHVYYPTPLNGVSVSQQAWDEMNGDSNFERIGDRYPTGARIAYNMSFLIPEDDAGVVDVGLDTAGYKYGIENGWTARSLRISHEDAGNEGVTSLDWRFSETAQDGQKPYMRMFSAICTHAANPFDFSADGGICTSYTKVVAIDREASTITMAFMAKLGGDNGGQTCSQVARFRVAKQKGWIELRKHSGNEDITNANACYALGGAVYGVYSDEACTQQVAQLSTDDSGYAKSDELKVGQYWVKEISASTGYALDVQAHGVEVRSKETSGVDSVQTVPNNPIDLVVRKIDRDTGGAAPQGSAKLAGAEFTVSYYDGYYEKGSLPKKATRSWVLKTDGNGQARLDDAHKAAGDAFYRNSAGRPCVPLGTVSVEETRAPEGYELGDAGAVVQQIRGKGDRATVETVEAFNAPTVPNRVKRGGVEIVKRDAELGESEALGGSAHDSADKEHSSLSGIVFTITNISAHDVRVDGADYGKGRVVKRIETAWDEQRRCYRAATSLDCLPYGDYEIAETATNRSYLLSDGAARAFQVREGKAFASFSNVFSNYVARNDLRLQKKGEGSSEALAHVPFALVNEGTGETHVLVTDGNGAIDTECGLALHSTATNAFDALLVQGAAQDGAADGAETQGDETAAPSLEMVKALVNSEVRISGAAIEAAGEPGRTGTWFGLGEDGGQAAADDGRGALPYGDYLLYELPCEANEGYRLFSTQLSVYADASVFARGYDLGTVIDYRNPQPPTLHTTATDAGDGDKFLVAGDAARIVDTVAYANLEPGESYRLEGVLMDKATGEAVRGADGEKTGACLEFEAPVTDGHVEVGFEVDTAELAGHELVVFETLFAGEEQLAAHADLDSASQTVRVVSLQTRLARVEKAGNGQTGTEDKKDGADGGEDAGSDESADGGEDAGEGESAQAEDEEKTAGETQESEKGNAGMEQTQEQGDEEGQTREQEQEQERGQARAQEQAHAGAGKPADKMLETGTRVTLVDTVAYTGFAPGQELAVKGVLMDKETGTPVLDQSGEEVRGQADFTAQEANGTVEVAFDLDTTGLAGKEIVAFETASAADGATIAEHADLDNADQTVYVQDEQASPPQEPQEPSTPQEPEAPQEPQKPQEPQEPATPQEPQAEQPMADTTAEEGTSDTAAATGDTARRVLLVAIAAAAAANLAYLYASRKRRKEGAGSEHEE